MYKLAGPGITLRLVNGEGEEMVIGQDGEIGYLEAGYSVKLFIAPTESNIWLIEVDGKKNIVVRKPSETSSDYVTSIHIWEAGVSKVACTRYPENHVRVLRYLSNGTVEMWEVALNSQSGKFWLTCQQSYSVSCGLIEDKFLCPQFAEKWPQLVATLENLLRGEKLPTEATPPKEDNIPTNALTGSTGVTKWWNHAQQLGMIITNTHKKVRVHWSQIIAPNGARRFLTPGMVVSFKSLRPIVVHEGQRPTGFTHEAIGVQPVDQHQDQRDKEVAKPPVRRRHYARPGQPG